MNAENNCVLKLDHLVFDEIAFKRVNFRSENDLSVEFGFNFEEHENGEFVASIRVIGTKEDEYTFVVGASGYFRLEDHVEDRKTIIQQNAVAIVFPYIRSQISLLTAQPEIEPVVLPAMNIAQMVEDAIKKGEEKSASCAN